MTEAAVSNSPRWGLPAALGVFSAWFAGAVAGSTLAVAIWGTDATNNAWALAVVFAVQTIGAVIALVVVTEMRGQHSFVKDFEIGRAHV